jgi:hypothetical protein
MEKITLISAEPSKCCASDARIVASRRGGMISRDCLKCGQSGYVNEFQIPKLPCVTCHLPMQIKKLDGTNFFYICSQCEQYYKIADIVPPWHDEFSYSGLAAYGDPGVPQ